MLNGESSSWSLSPSSLNTMAPNNEDYDLLISFQKSIHLTCNPYHIYNFLNYHWLNPSYLSFISSILQFQEIWMMYLIILHGDKLCLLKYKLLNIIAHRNEFLFGLGRRQMDVNGIIPLKLGQIMQLITLKLIGRQRTYLDILS